MGFDWASGTKVVAFKALFTPLSPLGGSCNERKNLNKIKSFLIY